VAAVLACSIVAIVTVRSIKSHAKRTAEIRGALELRESATRPVDAVRRSHAVPSG